MFDFIMLIISVCGLLGYIFNIPVMTYICACIVIGVDILLLFLPFFRKPNFVSFILGPILGYLIQHSILGVAAGICLVDIIYTGLWCLFRLLLKLIRKGAKKNKVNDKYVCSKCGFEVKENETVCPNCGSSF